LQCTEQWTLMTLHSYINRTLTYCVKFITNLISVMQHEYPRSVL
jgi:hypothetical protein